MFDKLVESTKQQPKGRSRFYLVTSLIYGTALSVVAVATIVWFNPAMAEANATTVMLTPPPIPIPATPTEPIPHTPTPWEVFAPPEKPPATIADPTKVLPKPPEARRSPGVAGVPHLTTGIGSGPGWSPNNSDGDSTEPPPPPPPTPAPTPKATPTPEPTPAVQKPLTVSSGVLHGKAIRKVQPPYPAMAKAIKAQGSVPVHITISEEGRVISAQAVGGHPMLQPAAQQAALQWVFSPTVLNGRGVKVSGVISFNFILN
ncbi:MAG TPA: energy transducer TonB [Blastocatellia bacterium]|nr:energy transducer TonB [Blastocatellia bacterium]